MVQSPAAQHFIVCSHSSSEVHCLLLAPSSVLLHRDGDKNGHIPAFVGSVKKVFVNFVLLQSK